jgi:hypothetical protein
LPTIETRAPLAYSSWLETDLAHGPTMPPRSHRTTEASRRHTRWRQRFFLASGSLLLVNIVLLYLLADAHRRPQMALDRTKGDVQLLSELIAGRLKKDELLQQLHEQAVPNSAIEQVPGRVNVGGLSFVIDNQQRVIKVEHWSIPGGAGTTP